MNDQHGHAELISDESTGAGTSYDKSENVIVHGNLTYDSRPPYLNHSTPVPQVDQPTLRDHMLLGDTIFPTSPASAGLSPSMDTEHIVADFQRARSPKRPYTEDIADNASKRSFK
ncbi:hypothetical protein BG004_005206 [Podila humilis]|nr:hypothetical protein BG004_005206 [Podila humilis]